MMSTVRVTHGQSHQYAVQGKRAKDALSRDEQDLFELCSLSGVDMSPAVFRIVLDLLKMNVSPVAIVQMLKSMAHRSATSPFSSASDMSALQTPSSHATEASMSGSRSGVSAGPSKTKENPSSQRSGRGGGKAPIRPRSAGKTSHKT